MTVYLLGVVLRYPPSAVAQRVFKTLCAAAKLLQTDRAAVSIWPIFIASAQAYTAEARILAEYVLKLSTGFGVGNRKPIHRIVKRVWEERDKAAAQSRIDVGDVLVDWRMVLREMGVKIVLL